MGRAPSARGAAPVLDRACGGLRGVDATATASPTSTTTGTPTAATSTAPSPRSARRWRPRPAAGPCSSSASAPVASPCRSPPRASRSGASTRRRPCSPACGPSPAATSCLRGRRHGRPRPAAVPGGPDARFSGVRRLQHVLQPDHRGGAAALLRTGPRACCAAAGARARGVRARARRARVVGRCPHRGHRARRAHGHPARPRAQTITGQHIQITEAGVRLRPWPLRYAAPAELDALASAAGLVLVEHWRDWRRTPFTADDSVHVSVYGHRQVTR